jgi:hypothetical protein
MNSVCQNESCDLGCELTKAKKEIAAAGAPDYSAIGDAVVWVVFWIAVASVLVTYILKVGKLPL